MSFIYNQEESLDDMLSTGTCCKLDLNSWSRCCS